MSQHAVFLDDILSDEQVTLYEECENKFKAFMKVLLDRNASRNYYMAVQDEYYAAVSRLRQSLIES